MAKLESCQSHDVPAVKSGALDGIEQARDDCNWVKPSLWFLCWRDQKDFFFSVQGKSSWFCFMVFCSFVFCHLCPVHKINAQTPIAAILSTYSLHECIVNVRCRMDWSYRKPYIYLSLNFLKQYFANETCLTSVNMQEPPSDFSERVKFPLTYTEIPRLVKLSLTGKRINFPGIVTHVTH